MQLATDLLRTFVIVADSGSFTQAGKEVHRTQSAVSMQIKRLETEVGHPLFERGRRALRLTREGETLLAYARRILSLHDEAVANFRKPELAGRVRLGAPEDYSVRFLPQILARFSAEYPQVLVEVFCEPSNQLQQALDQGDLDVAIRTCAEEPENGELIHWESVVWIASRQHPVHHADPLPLALYHEGCCFRRWALKALDSMDRGYRIAYASPSIAGIMAAVSAGLAVAPVSRSVVPPDVRFLTPEDGFPTLPAAPITLHRATAAASEEVDTLTRHVIGAFRELRIAS